MTPILGIMASQISGHLTPPSSFESISTVTVGGGGSATLLLVQYPLHLTHLQIRGNSKSYSATSGTMFFLLTEYRSNYHGTILKVTAQLQLQGWSSSAKLQFIA
jgi:hypothetical protein